MCNTSDPYAATAHDSRQLSEQPPQVRDHAGRLCIRLPWGNTQEVAPLTFIEDDSPAELREKEEEEHRNPGSYARKQKKFHNACDHICYRQAYASFWTRAWINIWGLGRSITLIGLALFLILYTPIALLILKDLRIIKSIVLNNKHISVILKSKTGFSIKSISFNSINTKIGEHLMSYINNINVIGQINENIWNNKKTLQLTIRDLIL